MSLPTLADVADLEIRLGATIDDTDQAEALLRYASALIRSYAGETWVVADVLTDVPDGVPEVCVEMVYRALLNPAGVSQDTAGPFSTSYGSDATQRIFLTKSDKAIIGRRGRAFTVDPTPALATDFGDYYPDTDPRYDEPWSETE